MTSQQPELAGKIHHCSSNSSIVCYRDVMYGLWGLPTAYLWVCPGALSEMGFRLWADMGQLQFFGRVKNSLRKRKKRENHNRTVKVNVFYWKDKALDVVN